ncbi:hypothetical protein JR316_0013203 [Psilocybe cubensis]|uniref:Uncharacterized protein n=2 Tax=Psilocybe cubensis TaxID=181762 RepID=A0ACB8GGD4_PSICU|nr:hypothetical protein JR316_0013203 [Psilocybe cubensis]KAH9474738.1 hypothetical protein JR316_0013203 [Psilocybe cubensis]
MSLTPTAEENSPSLPFDVLCSVAAALASEPAWESKFTTLSALSRCCSSLRAVCQQHIFHTINLCPRICDSSRRPSRPDNDYHVPSILFRELERILEHNLGIARYIRALHYNSHPSNFTGNRVSRLLDKLGELESLRVTFFVDISEFGEVEDYGTEDENYDINPISVNWQSFPSNLQNSLIGLINLQSFRRLDMEHVINFPVYLLKFSRLQMLHLAHCRILIPSALSHSSSEERAPTQLRSLYLAPGARVNADVLRTALDFSSIRVLEFEFVYQGDEEQVGELLDSTPQITSLALRIGRRCPDINVVSSVLAAHDRVCRDLLQHLCLSSKLEPRELPKSNNFLLFNMLKDVPSWDVLETISITLEEVPQFSDYYVKDLEKLDKHLSNKSIFPALRKVSISIELVINYAIDDFNPDDGPWSKLPEMHLLNLAHSSIDVDYSVGDFPGYSDY